MNDDVVVFLYVTMVTHLWVVHIIIAAVCIVCCGLPADIQARYDRVSHSSDSGLRPGH